MKDRIRGTIATPDFIDLIAPHHDALRGFTERLGTVEIMVSCVALQAPVLEI